MTVVKKSAFQRIRERDEKRLSIENIETSKELELLKPKQIEEESEEIAFSED